MLKTSKIVDKKLKKHQFDNRKFRQIYQAVLKIDETKNIKLYDCIEMQDQHQKLMRTYYRIKKGDYRGVFYFEDNDTVLYNVGVKPDVYKDRV